jgi:hypothetical protein
VADLTLRELTALGVQLTIVTLQSPNIVEPGVDGYKRSIEGIDVGFDLHDDGEDDRLWIEMYCPS